MQLEVNKTGGWLSSNVYAGASAVIATQIATGRGKLGPWHLSNVSSANPANVRFFDVASAPTPGTTPTLDRLILNKSSQISVGGDGFEGIPFETGLYLYVSSAVADNDTTALTAAGDVTGQVRYALREAGYSGP